MTLPPNLITGKTAQLPGDLKKHVPLLRAKRIRNKTEQRYSEEVLEMLQGAGLIAQWEFEGTKFKLGDGAWYKPDFTVWLPDGRVRLIEIKGFHREAAIVRFKVARSKYPFCEWWMIQDINGEWTRIL